MKVVNFKSKDQEEIEKNKEYMLSIIDEFRQSIETGEVQEFIISYMDMNNNVEISASCKDLVGAIGIAEMGKQIIIQQSMMEWD